MSSLPKLGPVRQIISRLPRPYPNSEELLGELITEEFAEIWAGLLSEEELEELPDAGSKLPCGKLDAMIIRQAETLGMRLMLSEFVRTRLIEWEELPEGPELSKELGKALARAMRIMQRKERPPLDDPDIYDHKAEVVVELRLVLKAMRETFLAQHRVPSGEEVCALFQRTIERDPEAFIHLRANLDSWLKFFTAQSVLIKGFLAAERGSPATLFNAWWSWATGHGEEWVRDQISRTHSKST